MLKDYYLLTKPGIVFGNAITASAGFILASKEGQFDFIFFATTLIGLSLIVASGCVLNNYFDRLSDQKMHRTRSRPLAKGTIPIKTAVVIGFALLFLGTTVLLFTTFLATLFALLGFVLYVGFYTLWKYKTEFATELGSIAGATPPLVGYTAVSNDFDLGALLLFAIVALWQMPHFFAIAIYRIEEYASASIPVLPLKRGVQTTKYRMLFYLGAFILAALSLPLFGYTSTYYSVVAVLLSIYWLWICLQGFKAESDKRWARKVFLASLVVILGLCLTIALEALGKG